VKEICLQLLPVFTECRLDNYAIQTNVLAVLDLHISLFVHTCASMYFPVMLPNCKASMHNGHGKVNK
jgi:hypothetical protein